ncbi:hypothetical protein [Candidatus Borrarchaeum sp.]|uniref:hypothetical protein n=1 Tax=Candidatus Borrarchaeum sp. TaxID=2846742 RepID=UPI00257B0582|nr:hypothetical protein [Candidatus Borrarchaeum sp.]
MGTKIRDLTTDELRILISETVKEALEDFIEDILEFLSEELVKSVEDAGQETRKAD